MGVRATSSVTSSVHAETESTKNACGNSVTANAVATADIRRRRRGRFTLTIEINDRGEARKVLLDYELTERAIDQAFQPIASSLMVDGRKGVEKLQGERKDALKGFIEGNGNEAVEDAEMEVTARISPRSTTPQYDLRTCAETEQGAAAIIEAARLGWLKLDHKMITDFRKRTPGASFADILVRFQMPAGVTTALYIDRGRL